MPATAARLLLGTDCRITIAGLIPRLGRSLGRLRPARPCDVLDQGCDSRWRKDQDWEHTARCNMSWVLALPQTGLDRLPQVAVAPDRWSRRTEHGSRKPYPEPDRVGH